VVDELTVGSIRALRCSTASAWDLALRRDARK
jgi:hypothetical protein